MNWNDVNKVLPDKDGDYLVFIKGAEIPCVLSFHSDCGVFYDENHECYYNINAQKKQSPTQNRAGDCFYFFEKFCVKAYLASLTESKGTNVFPSLFTAIFISSFI